MVHKVSLEGWRELFDADGGVLEKKRGRRERRGIIETLVD